ncbi:hypothetical protein [Microbacterium sp. T2.11-28]|uniref:hypothetical protein n=1 Tax=unclassified Microbacterium TaxID=2609290 RepID=UPI00247779C1|nr:hypothetical protein [Microbacterium sp. T2.11-28]CAI9386198.1 hypothetical protein MICABA_00244 [Microbacterium sp. T2.11-28]
MTLATIAVLAAGEAEHHGNVQAETFIFGVIAFVVFLALGLVTLSYRNVANRHAHKAEAYAQTHGTDLAQAGHGHH